jgi:hypothetical protein
MPLSWDDIYDRGKRRFKYTLIPLAGFLLVLIIIFFIGLAWDVPAMTHATFFTLAIGIMALAHDHWILNSMVGPTWFLFAASAVGNVFTGHWFYFAIHVVTAVIAIIIVFRKNASFVVMMFSTAFYAVYIYSIRYWNGVYACDFWFCDATMMAISVLVSGTIISVIATIVNYNFKKRGEQIDCEGGICPW